MKTKTTAKKIVSSDGVEIYYWNSWKPGMGDRFYVLHPGAALNHTSLERLELVLNERGIPTINFDPRGSGYSDHPVPREYFKLERLTADLGTLIEHEGIEEPTLLTHSFGFMPGIDYAVKTNNVNGLVGLCASHHFRETAQNPFLFQLFDKLLIYSEYLGSLGTSAMHMLMATSRKDCNDQSNPSSEFDLWCSIVDIPLKDASSHVIGQRECNTWDISEQLRALKSPLALIYGSNDTMVTPIAGEYIRQRVSVPCFVDVIEGAGHTLPVRYPERVMDVLDDRQI